MKADLILTNASIYSPLQNGSVIKAQAVAVKEGKILMTGSDEDIKALSGPETMEINCEGNTVLPGLSDVHCHASIAGSATSGCDLFGIYRQDDESASDVIEQYLDRLKTFIEEHPDKPLIRGTGWVEANFTGDAEFPTCKDLDRICSDKPIILEAFSQHNLWVNSKAMEIAGVTKETPDTNIGKIYRDNEGNPTGIFNDPEAMDLIKANVPGYDLSVEEYMDALMWYQKECANKYGVTLIQDCMYSDNARDAYVRLAKEDKLTIRARGVYFLEPNNSLNQLENYIERKGTDDVGDDFRIDTVKMFAEGEFNLIDGYEKEFCEAVGAPVDHNGPLYWSDEEFTACAEKSMNAGLNVHVHAMGDGAVLQSARCLAEAQKKTGKAPRNTIAHLMLVPDECYELIADNNIIANCQMRWMVCDDDVLGMIPLMGKDRAMSAYPLRKFIDKGIVVAQGTDFPVTPPPDVMEAIQCAMTRRVFKSLADYDRLKDNVLGTEEPASLEEAIRIATINSAYQVFAENITGSIEPGKSADFAILDRNIENTPVEDIHSIEINKTIFKGNIVYEK